MGLVYRPGHNSCATGSSCAISTTYAQPFCGNNPRVPRGIILTVLCPSLGTVSKRELGTRAAPQEVSDPC